MNRFAPWIGPSALLAAIIAGLAYARCSGHDDGARDARLATLAAAVHADSQVILRQRARISADSVARVHAEAEAVRHRNAATAAKARSDSLDQLVRFVDSAHVEVAGATVELPPLVVRDIAELRMTVATQAAALQADTVHIRALDRELSDVRGELAGTRSLADHQGEKAAVLEGARPWWKWVGGVVLTAGSAAGGGAIGALVGGPAGAAIGAAAGAVLAAMQ
ncbi:MAG: hypothetical protein U9Q74_01435 [Gemmatimonadota bacterium]|nr:hypothetical protein [Gemmatimonadota bacterium]